jgi:hypothetical protein
LTEVDARLNTSSKQSAAIASEDASLGANADAKGKNTDFTSNGVRYKTAKFEGI